MFYRNTDYFPGQSYILTIHSYEKVITFCVELSFPPNAKCYKILMTTLVANFRSGEGDEVRNDVFSSDEYTSIVQIS